jgi:hypothetical protein
MHAVPFSLVILFIHFAAGALPNLDDSNPVPLAMNDSLAVVGKSKRFKFTHSRLRQKAFTCAENEQLQGELPCHCKEVVRCIQMSEFRFFNEEGEFQ